MSERKYKAGVTWRSLRQRSIDLAFGSGSCVLLVIDHAFHCFFQEATGYARSLRSTYSVNEHATFDCKTFQLYSWNSQKSLVDEKLKFHFLYIQLYIKHLDTEIFNDHECCSKIHFGSHRAW